VKIALLGYGKMGKLVETIARREGMQVGPKLDINDNPRGTGITAAAMEGVDVAIEFSQPDAVLSNIEAAAAAGVHIVVGTTGWADQYRKVERIGLVHGANFSLGMNLFFEIISHSARLIGMLPQYDAYVSEEHHRAKKDAPSGTALNLLDLMRPYLANPNLSIASIRAGAIPGTHVVGFDSEADTILFEHRARSRQGFAEGAVLAARWIAGRKGFYDFRKIFREIVGIQ
jgi:4-hydroxy-tetrahydrodipicolinate reductase